jgi:hypothetical protein
MSIFIKMHEEPLLMGRAPDWDVRQHHNHCDTIAYSAIDRAHPSTREARGTGGGRSSLRGTPTTPLHTAPKFLPEKGREARRTREQFDVVAKKVNLFT